MSDLRLLQRIASDVLGRSVTIFEDRSFGLDLAGNVAGLAWGHATIFLGRTVPNWARPSIVCHECGHLALVTQPIPVVPTAEVLQAACSGPWRSWPAHAGPLWRGHELPFVRAVLHCRQRFRNLSFGRAIYLQDDLIFAHEIFGLSSLAAYDQAFDFEAARTDLVTLKTVLARPVPKAAQDLFLRDIRKGIADV